MFRLILPFFLVPFFLFCSVSTFSSSEVAAEKAARRIADLIVSRKGEKTVLGLATGSTMIPVYQELKKIIQKEKIDLKAVVTFNLDEYLDIPLSHPESYHSFMHTHLFNELFAYGLKSQNIHIPCGSTWEGYEEKIKKEGPIDLQLLGIGRNGHIGFAEPGVSPFSRTMIVDLAESTREDNARFFNGRLELVPRRAVSMGIATILEAKEIILLAFGENKAKAVQEAIRGAISSQVPATFLQKHPKVDFYLDAKAAEGLKQEKIRCFTNARLLIDHQFVEGELWTEGGKVAAKSSRSADEVIDMGGKMLAPGLIDLQINGAFGCDFSRNPEKLEKVASQLAQFGVTTFFPTIVSSSPERYQELLTQLQPDRFDGKKAANAGIHLEGPFFCPKRVGAHFMEHLVIAATPLEEVYGDIQGVQIITLAPELPGMEELIFDLKKRGIVVAAGHSSATFQEMKKAIKEGVTFATHLFNAMTPYHHREPGIVGAALIDPQIAYTVIADGNHLAPETVAMSYKCNPEGLILVTDATEALGRSEGVYRLGPLEIDCLEEALYVRGTNTLAGSKLSLDKAVKRLCEYTECSKAFALEAASLKPAIVSGLYPIKGTFTIGADADFVAFSEDLSIEATYIGAEKVWEAILE